MIILLSLLDGIEAPYPDNRQVLIQFLLIASIMAQLLLKRYYNTARNDQTAITIL
ncbi:hypothetical protein O185_13300 [Photorhabdus temperata J3]|uniref:Uncharacterized protein n=1 Tax=Photorhabdus temperata J3 TaxID=1389415 RepID=U7QZS6_PHOTE|nr:hypothetical protein O185_13300 [Photorhabdus temperata J3]